MKRIGVFVDVSNLYFCVKAKFKDRRLDYKKYMAYCSEFGKVELATAYGCQMATESRNFIRLLQHAGLTTKYKTPKMIEPGKLKGDWDVGIAVEMIANLARPLDAVILGSADGDMEPAVTYVQAQGVEVYVLACNISRELRTSARECFEVTESMLL